MAASQFGDRTALFVLTRCRNGRARIFALILWAGLTSGLAQGAEVSVAVAANFASPLESLGALFEKKTGHRLLISAGATGKLIAQIRNGAPFEVFLSADKNGPTGLVKDGLAIRESQFTYAKGRLVLWSTLPIERATLRDSTSPIESKPDPTQSPSPFNAKARLVLRSATPEQLSALLRESQVKHLALANPRLAPYGAAAKEFMESVGVWGTLLPKFVYGENITQTYQFVATGNAEMGFVALSQVQSKEHVRRGSLWLIASAHHAPLEQDAVLLKSAKTKSAAQEFFEFLKSTEARKLMESTGYEVGAAQ
jgi:molybdate transport system substrate-binding protein